jgi:hypothetical protein
MLKKKSMILPFSEIYGNNIASSEENYKPEVVPYYNRTKCVLDVGDQMTREHL